MHSFTRKGSLFKHVVLFGILLPCMAVVPSRSFGSRSQTARQTAGGQVRIPNRPSAPLFTGQLGRQKTEIHFDPASHVVTMKLLVQDPNGYFIPNIRREDFVVYENGIKQQILDVNIEHAPVALALLMEFGGHAQALNRDLSQQVSAAGRQLLDELRNGDSLTVWRYGDTIEKVADSSQDQPGLLSLFLSLSVPPLSEINLYDALGFMVGRMRQVKGRKAIVLISTGVDTFSKATYADALQAVEQSDTPVYVISLVHVLRQIIRERDYQGTLARLDWEKLGRDLQEIARLSGGRAYSPPDTIDLSSIYDDIAENLRVRYVVTYRSCDDSELQSKRTVRVELINAKTGGPLQLLDASGRTIHARVIAQETYTTGTAR